MTLRRLGAQTTWRILLITLRCPSACALLPVQLTGFSWSRWRIVWRKRVWLTGALQRFVCCCLSLTPVKVWRGLLWI